MEDAFLDGLVIEHMSLANTVAVGVYRQAPQAMDLDELRSLAYMGLVKAAGRWYAYCAEKGYSPAAVEYFPEFAKRRMRGSIYDNSRATDWTSRSNRARAKQLQNAGQDEGLSETELSERTGLTVDEIRSTMAGMSHQPVSIDTASSDDFVEARDVEQTVTQQALLEAMTCTINQLPPAQQVVLALHYFLAKELQEVAAIMDITESRASHLHTEAVLEVYKALTIALVNQSEQR